VLGGGAREEAESVCGSVALLSPAAAIPKRMHTRTRRAPSPPLPHEQGRPATTEETGKATSLQAVCRPAACCSGALSGLGTRAGHRRPHVAGSCRWLGWWDRRGGRSYLLPGAAAERIALHKFTLSDFLGFFVVLISSLGSKETAFFCWDSCTSVPSLICCRN